MNDQNVLEPHVHDKLVTITLDGLQREIERGNFPVSVLKQRLGVPADYELDEVKHGEFKPLDDNGHTEIKGGEILVSHVRRGGAS